MSRCGETMTFTVYAHKVYGQSKLVALARKIVLLQTACITLAPVSLGSFSIRRSSRVAFDYITTAANDIIWFKKCFSFLLEKEKHNLFTCEVLAVALDLMRREATVMYCYIYVTFEGSLEAKPLRSQLNVRLQQPKLSTTQLVRAISASCRRE
jgi:hypothetical protein